MELRHLRHFVALAEELSFTRAASREHIVQSGLSTSIRALEKEVGALLFVRGTRPVRLTAEGTALLPAARRTLDAAAAAQQAVEDAHGVLTGTLRIGALQTSGHSLPFASWLAAFALDHPRVDISVQQLPALQMLELVADGGLDCALVSLVSEQAPGLEVVPLITEPLVLACIPTHRLAGRQGVALEELQDERFVEPPAQWAIRTVADRAFRDAGLTRRIACEVNEWTMLLDLVAAGAGIALVPDGLIVTTWSDTLGTTRPGTLPSGAARTTGSGTLPSDTLGTTGGTAQAGAAGRRAGLVLIPLTGVELMRRVDLVLPRGHAATPAARRFREYVVPGE